MPKRAWSPSFPAGQIGQSNVLCHKRRERAYAWPKAAADIGRALRPDSLAVHPSGSASDATIFGVFTGRPVERTHLHVGKIRGDGARRELAIPLDGDDLANLVPDVFRSPIALRAPGARRTSGPSRGPSVGLCLKFHLWLFTGVAGKILRIRTEATAEPLTTASLRPSPSLSTSRFSGSMCVISGAFDVGRDDEAAGGITRPLPKRSES